MIHTCSGNPLSQHLVPPTGQTFPHEQHLDPSHDAIKSDTQILASSAFAVDVQEHPL